MATVEHELKLAADDGFELPDLTDALPGSTSSPLAARRLEANYYDTADGRLGRHGITLRHRTGDDPPWTLKLPVAGASASALRRFEVTAEGGAGAVPDRILALLTAHLRHAALEPVASLVTERSGLVLFLDGERAVEVVDDRVAARRTDGTEVRFREIEAEAVGGPPRALRAVGKRLRAAGARADGAQPKLARVLAGDAGAAAVDGEALGPSARLLDVARAAVAAGFTRLLTHDPLVRLGEDPEAVHQARVATRRLRSDIRTLRDSIDGAWAFAVGEELRWLGEALGRVRDADVLDERLTAQVAGLPEVDRVMAAKLVGRLRTDRDAALADLLAVLSGERYFALLDRLEEAARRPPVTLAAEARAADTLPRLVRRRWRQLAAGVDALGADPADEDLHGVRIRAKRVRYAAEAAAPVVGKPARRHAAKVADVQEVLGSLQDAVTAEAWLREHSRKGGAAIALAAGELVMVQRQEAARARDEWRKAWKKASGKKVRSWL